MVRRPPPDRGRRRLRWGRRGLRGHVRVPAARRLRGGGGVLGLCRPGPSWARDRPGRDARPHRGSGARGAIEAGLAGLRGERGEPPVARGPRVSRGRRLPPARPSRRPLARCRDRRAATAVGTRGRPAGHVNPAPEAGRAARTRGARRPRAAAALPSPRGVRHRPVEVASRVALGDLAAPVVELLAAPEPDLQLRVPPAVDEEPERDDRQALRLGLAQQFVDLVAMEEQLPGALRLVVEAVAPGERRDVGADKPGLAALDPRVGLLETDVARPDRLDLRSGQDQAGLERVLDGVVVAGLAVEGDGRFAHRRRLLVVDGDAGARVRLADARRPAPLPEPALERVSSCPPAGASVRRMLPARWCTDADYCLSLHITSFRLGKPYMTTRVLASGRTRPAPRGSIAGPDRGAGWPQAARSHASLAVGAPSALSAASMYGSPVGVVAGANDVTTRSGVRPFMWMQRLSGVSHFAIVSRKPPELSLRSTHCWMVPFPYVVSPTSVPRFVSCRAPDTISLAEALPLLTRTMTRIPGSVATRPARRRSRSGCRRRSPPRRWA